MQAKLPLRISSIILFLFALGHTVGFQTFRPHSPGGLEVMEAMRSVPFTFGSATVHWMDLFRGFGFSISVSGFAFAILAWRLSSATVSEASLARAITWLLCAVQAGGIVLSLLYFGPIQAMFSVVSMASLAWSAIRLGAASKTPA